jgi:hypothetical protein
MGLGPVNRLAGNKVLRYKDFQEIGPFLRCKVANINQSSK